MSYATFHSSLRVESTGMDLSQLPKLGQVAGVPGIALGAAVLLLSAVLAGADLLPEGWRGPVAVLVILGAVLLTVVALRGRARSTQFAQTSGAISPASNYDASKDGGSQIARTLGDNSPASNVRK